MKGFLYAVTITALLAAWLVGRHLSKSEPNDSIAAPAIAANAPSRQIVEPGTSLGAGAVEAFQRTVRGYDAQARAVPYTNAQYGFAFFLPASWRGYSVLIQQWDGERYLAAKEESEVTDHGPVIVLRNPRWQAGDPYQDIPILVFTRSQWEGGPPDIGAGGMVFEIGHNSKYVFGIHSRYNAADDVKGWGEAGDIVARNSEDNGPPLHDQ